MVEIPPSVGVYVVIFCLKHNTDLVIGSLGSQSFNKGFYLYSGSAKGLGGLNRRLKRHLKRNTNIFWHIDYLKKHCQTDRIWYLVTDKSTECDLAQSIGCQKGVSFYTKRFGASDCRSGCFSHLLYAPSSSNLDLIYRGVKKSFPLLNQVMVM